MSPPIFKYVQRPILLGLLLSLPLVNDPISNLMSGQIKYFHMCADLVEDVFGILFKKKLSYFFIKAILLIASPQSPKV